MARHVLSRSSTTPTRVADAKNGDSLVQRAGVTTTVTDDFGIVGAGNNRVTLNGTLKAALDGVQIHGQSRNGSPDYGSGQTSRITIERRASIESDAIGVSVSFDTLKLTNNGLIDARSGVQAYQTSNSDIVNNGTIRSQTNADYGTGITVVSGTNNHIVNRGTIDFANATAIYIGQTSNNGRADVINTGTISGWVVVGTPEGEVVNAGQINGSVLVANTVNSGTINGNVRIEEDHGSYRGTGDINGSITSSFSGGLTIEIDGDLVTTERAIIVPGGEPLTETGGSGLTTTVRIGANGSLTSQDSALNVNYDTLLFTNNGDISSGTGITAYRTENSEIVNNGTIVRNGALEYGTGITVVSGSNNHIVNTGTIDYGDQTAIYIGQNGSGDRPDVTNSGTITGWVVGGAPDGDIVNSGRINGVVLLSHVVNSGVIDGRIDGTTLDNSGTVTGEVIAERVVNSGSLKSVLLQLETAAGGYYDGRKGSVASVVGSDGNDTILGGAGKETLIGGAGDDLINGGRYHDTLTGGAGDDVFQFEKISGYDVITDFEDGDDLIDLSALGLRGFRSLEKAISSNADGDAVIDLSDLNGAWRGTITLEGVSASELDRSDFIF